MTAPWLPRASARRLRRLGTAGDSRWRRTLAASMTAACRHRWRTPLAVAVSTGALGWLAGGPVAAAVAASYATAGCLAACRHWRTRLAEAATVAALDAVTALAADLRAGLAPAAALAYALPAVEASTVDDVRRLAEQLAAAWRVADRAGVPLADLLDRLESDARGLRRVRAAGAAQAAGARATALLLAALPVAGLALGYGMGTDPVHVLLGTPLGGVCAGLAIAFQLSGLAWSSRLARTVAEVC
jgi:tight adherence protein B